MNLEGIISITGKGGLHKVVSKTKGGLVVESIIDGKRCPIFAANQVSALEDVSIFSTEDENIALVDILTTIHKAEAGKVTPVNAKDAPEKLKDYFAKIVPTYDAERVYVSHIKKIISWYNLLLEKGLLVIEKDKKEASEKKTVAKKATPKKANAKVSAPKVKSAATAKQIKMPSRKG
jgi:hypothetical protein